MKTEAHIWLERLSTLRLSLVRQAAAKVGLQATHVEILEYLALCNRYSNTAQALTDYLGLTKGSISQSLKFLEKQGFISRTPSKEDKRSSNLSLTLQGTMTIADVQKEIPIVQNEESDATQTLSNLLKSWQQQQGMKSFGLCHSCRYNEKLDTETFRCGLTKETLSLEDTQKLCKEHEFS